MTRKIGLIIVSILFMTIIINANEGGDDWKHSKEISISNIEGYKEFYIDEDIYRYANEDLGDIRIVNEENEFQPYYILKGELSYDIVSDQYAMEMVNEFQKNNDQYFDFQVINNKINTDVLANELSLIISDRDYMENVKIYGSYDNQRWDYMKGDIIYKVPEKVKSSIFLGHDLKYSYYRIVFVNNVEKIVMGNVELLYNHQYSDEKKFNFVKSIPFEVKNEESSTIITIKNEDRLKINFLELLSEDIYNRSYTISRKDELGNSKQINSGEIYNISLKNFEAINNRINVYPVTRGEELTIVIDNQDSKAIHIEDIKINYFVDKIVFKGNDVDKSYKVLFGNTNAEKASYDIESYSEYIEKSETKEKVELGQVVTKDIEEEVQEEEDFNYGLILNIVIVGIAVVLLVLIGSKLRNVSKE